MAVLQTSMRLVGTTANDDDYEKTYKNFNNNVTDQNLVTLAQKIASASTNRLIQIVRISEKDITAQEG